MDTFESVYLLVLFACLLIGGIDGTLPLSTGRRQGLYSLLVACLMFAYRLLVPDASLLERLLILAFPEDLPQPRGGSWHKLRRVGNWFRVLQFGMRPFRRRRGLLERREPDKFASCE